MPHDLTSSIGRRALANELKAAINEWCIKEYSREGGPNRLGPSDSAPSCWRYVWYKFRWFAFEQHDGRMYRIFEEGNRHESWFFEWLKGIGLQVTTHQQNGKQIYVAVPSSHFAGRIDGLVNISNYTGQFLIEFKTSGTGAKFTHLDVDGVKQTKVDHWTQMCIYGYWLKIKYALYLSYNKNDSDIYVEIVELDWEIGKSQTNAMLRVIDSPSPPPKISEDASYYICRGCQMKEVCHLDKEPEHNCRSCAHSCPSDQGGWSCGLYKMTIPKDFISQGCPQWRGILK